MIKKAGARSFWLMGFGFLPVYSSPLVFLLCFVFLSLSLSRHSLSGLLPTFKQVDMLMLLLCISIVEGMSVFVKID